MLKDEILALAQTMSGAEEEDGALALLCEAAEAELRDQLRPGLSAEECAPAFTAAAAWMALAGWYAGHSAGDIRSFSAGDLTIQNGPADPAALLAQADRVMAPYRVDRGFAFQGVRG